MQILDYNHHIETQLCQDEMWFGGCGDFGGTCSSSAKATSDDKVTTIKQGFNDHAVLLPNGCKVIIYETGEVYLQEKGGAQKKLRNKDAVEKFVIQ
jgi:hypothetical protein